MNKVSRTVSLVARHHKQLETYAMSWPPFGVCCDVTDLWHLHFHCFLLLLRSGCVIYPCWGLGPLKLNHRVLNDWTLEFGTEHTAWILKEYGCWVTTWVVLSSNSNLKHNPARSCNQNSKPIYCTHRLYLISRDYRACLYYAIFLHN